MNSTAPLRPEPPGARDVRRMCGQTLVPASEQRISCRRAIYPWIFGVCVGAVWIVLQGVVR